VSKHYGLSDTYWKDDKLYFHKKDTKLKIIPSENELFRIEWPDRVKSADFYNFTRAREAAKLYVLKHVKEFF